MRIGEERDRRRREENTLARLPGALEELHRELAQCIEAYTAEFGKESADIHFFAGKIRIATREQKNGKWEPAGKIEIVNILTLPGFKIDRGTDEPLLIEVGLLPGDKLFYRSADEFLTVEEMTRRILDRVLFPKLKE
jgi:hypothetical protein